MKLSKPKAQIIEEIIEIHDRELLLSTLSDILYNDPDFLEDLRMKLSEISEDNIIYYHRHYRGDLYHGNE